MDLDRSTPADWVDRAAFELRPVGDALMRDLKTSRKLFMPSRQIAGQSLAGYQTRPARRSLILVRGRPKGYLWALARDDPPWGGTAPPAVACTDANGRGGQHAERILQGEEANKIVSGTVLSTNGYA